MIKKLIKKILGDKASVRGTVIIRSYKAGTKELLQELVFRNLIMQGANIGKDLIVQKMIAAYTGTDPYTLHITHGAIGTSSTAPAITDTRLGNESARVSLTYAQDSGYNEAVLQFFFPDSTLTNQTYYEFGIFVDGTATVNSGQLFNHVLFGTPYAKSAGVDTTVEVDITFT
jgi:hypothetical protein